MSPTALVEQLDLLDGWTPAPVPPRRPLMTPAAEVVQAYLSPRELLEVVQALDDPTEMRAVIAEFKTTRAGHASGPRRYTSSPRGIAVTHWHGLDPFSVTWTQLTRIVRERTTPALAEELTMASLACSQLRRSNPATTGTSVTQTQMATYATETDRRSARLIAAAHAILPPRETRTS